MLLSVIVPVKKTYATHAEGADITYRCLGGNQYELTVSFYRDCHGVNAPGSATVNCSSLSTGQNFNLTLQPIPGTGQEIPIVCSSATTECQGGTYPGVQEWIYRATVTLSAASDWVFSFDLCCRNAAITTISNPGGQNIHVEATLNNLNFPCNSSPAFSTKPVPFICINQNFTFNNGASDPDGDFITYEVINPMNGANSSVTYLPPYTASQPLTTSMPMGFDTVTGDINMESTMLEVTVLAVKVKQWRNNQLVGYVIRDIQLRSMNCNNSYPYISGIGGTWAFISNACVGTNLNFNIYTYDPDPSQVITLTWNNGITGATFTVSPGANPTGNFSWTPGTNDIGTHCFTITVSDDNCPINGRQTYSICLVVTGVEINVTTTNANCGASNGTATAAISGGTSPFNLQWLHCVCAVNTVHGLNAGTYTAMVTDAKGCTAMSTGTVSNGSAPGNISMDFTPASCFGGNDGTATANANGGQQPYTYLWSNGNSTQTITGLSTGNYTVSVTTAQGCVKTDSITVTEPAPLSSSVSKSDALCFGGNSGTASVSISGGTTPYTYQWSNGSSAQSVTNLAAGNYSVNVTTAEGCMITDSILVTQPPILSADIFSSDALCFGASNGVASVFASGGTLPHVYQWNNGNTTPSVTGLVSGNYFVTVTDSNNCVIVKNIFIGEPAQLILNNVSQSNVTCFGGNNGTAAVAATGGISPYTYLWNPALSSATAPVATGLSARTYSVIVTDMNGCSQMNTTTITQPTALSVSVTNTQNVSCYGLSNGAIGVNANGGTAPHSYMWSNSQTSSVATGLSSGNYTITITDANGCSAVAYTTITQPNSMAVTVSQDDTICPGQSSNISANTSGGTTPYTYFWQPNVGFGNTQAVSPSATTSYTAIVTDANGCTSSSAVTISVHSQIFSLTANATPAICKGQNATISASATGASVTNYYWSNNMGNGAGPYVVSPAVTTTYSVTAYNVCGASITTYTTIIVHPLPQISIPPQAAAACGRTVLHFTGTSSGNNGATYAWNFGDGSTSNQVNPIHSYYQSGTYTVSVTVTSVYGCSSSAQGICTITVFPEPEAIFTSDPALETSIMNPYFHFFDQSQNATSWDWNFGDGKKSSLQNPTHTYEEIGIYTVTLIARNAGTCIDSIVKTVEVKPEFGFYLPNTFTPNGDNINDIFTGKGTEIIEFEMIIFDRWGEEIFKTNDLEKGWDGTAKGGDAISQDGIYVYQIKLRDFEKKSHSYTGHVNLVK